MLSVGWKVLTQANMYHQKSSKHNYPVLAKGGGTSHLSLKGLVAKVHVHRVEDAGFSPLPHDKKFPAVLLK